MGPFSRLIVLTALPALFCWTVFSSARSVSGAPQRPASAASAPSRTPAPDPDLENFRDLIASLSPADRRTVASWLRNLDPKERRDLRALMVPLSPKARQAKLLEMARAGRKPDGLDSLKQRLGIAEDPDLPDMTIQPRNLTGGVYRASGLIGNRPAPLPRVGSLAPAWTLESLSGAPLSSKTFRSRPLVLHFGSLTCPVYRAKIPAMAELRRKYADRADFVTVYTLEAHPQGSPSPYSDREWIPLKNVAEGQLKPQPSTMEQRRRHALEAVEKLGETRSLGIDRMDNQVWRAFGARPNSAFLIGADGRILLAQEWADPEALDAALAKLP